MAPIRADRRLPDRELSAIDTIRRYVARRNATTLRFARAITAREHSSSLLDWREVFTSVTADIRRHREASDPPVLANAVLEQIQAVGQRVREVSGPPVNQLAAVHQATYAAALADRTQPGHYHREIFMRLSDAIDEAKENLSDQQYLELYEATQHARNMWTATHEAVYRSAYDHAVGNPAATRQAAFDAAVEGLPNVIARGDDSESDESEDEGEEEEEARARERAPLTPAELEQFRMVMEQEQQEMEDEGEGDGESANWTLFDNPDDEEVVYRGDIRALRETVPPAASGTYQGLVDADIVTRVNITDMRPHFSAPVVQTNINGLIARMHNGLQSSDFFELRADEMHHVPSRPRDADPE